MRFKFKLQNGTYTVIGCKGFGRKAVIPATYEGKPVTAIGDRAFFRRDRLKSVTVPDSVTTIGWDAFCSCSNLTSVTIPASVTGIGYEAFYGCSNLNAVYITDLAAWCNITFGSTSANPLCYAKNLYLNGQLVTALEIPNGITAIKDYAFRGCTGLTSITIPASVTSIGSHAFYECSNLTAVYISDLAAWCNIEFSDYYSNPLFYAKNLYLNGQLVTALEIPNGTTAIKDYAFRYCSNLASVTIPASVTSIGFSAFSYCSNLTSITIPASVTSIGNGAFSGCDSLTSVTFANPNGWWYASSSTATGGTAIPAADLSDPETAAAYLKSIYYYYSWKRT